MPDSAPSPHQLEISVFGPGFGECILVHVGGGDWIVVDSCIDRKSGQPVALDYLRSLGVNPASQVKLVVATHWHDDHIRGIAHILDVAASAKFVISSAYPFKKLLEMVELGAKPPSQSSATKEFHQAIAILQRRQQKGERATAVGPIRASANKKLLALTSPGRSFSAEIFSLSPADSAVALAEAELHYSLAAIKDRTCPPRQGANELSIVLWLKVGVLDVLLGADLEYVSGITEGWRAIIRSAERPNGRAGFFKVPHHGSENADCPDSWTELLAARPIAVLTPHSPSRLPRRADIRRLCSRTPLVLLTSDPSEYSIPRRDKTVERTMKESVISRRALSGQIGHVRIRCDARTVGEAHLIELGNGAKRACASNDSSSSSSP